MENGFMTLQQFMIAYQENRRDIFILHYSDTTEIARIGMTEYFASDFDAAFGDAAVSSIAIHVADNFCLVFSITLDLANENEIDDDYAV